jgi:beta-glucosidase
LGISHFRFSLSWPRIFPDDSGKLNDRGMDYYQKVVDTCLENGVIPWITLYH